MPSSRETARSVEQIMQSRMRVPLKYSSRSISHPAPLFPSTEVARFLVPDGMAFVLATGKTRGIQGGMPNGSLSCFGAVAEHVPASCNAVLTKFSPLPSFRAFVRMEFRAVLSQRDFLGVRTPPEIDPLRDGTRANRASEFFIRGSMGSSLGDAATLSDE